MGEPKLGDFMTIEDLMDELGLSYSYFTKKARVLEPALLKIGGVAPRPHKYRVDKLKKILEDEDKKLEQKSRVTPTARRRRRLSNLTKNDKLFED